MRVLEALRAGYGACQLGAPELIAQKMLGVRLDGRARAVVRVLGARQLLQAAVLSAGANGAYGPLLHRLGAVVDFLHSASMVALAASDERRREAAAADAVVAALFATAELAAAARAGSAK